MLMRSLWEAVWNRALRVRDLRTQSQMSQMAQASDALCVLAPYFSPISNDRTLPQLNKDRQTVKGYKRSRKQAHMPCVFQQRSELLARPITSEGNKHMQMQLSGIYIVALD